MDYLIDRMRAAECDDIRVVTRPEKTDVVDHALSQDLTIVRARPSSVSESLLAGLEGTCPDDLILIGFPDTIWEPVDGFVRLVKALGSYKLALGVFRGSEPQRSDVVELGPAGLVSSVTVKPLNPRSDWIWGCAVARRSALDDLTADPEPGNVFDSMSAAGDVIGVVLESFVDVGTPQALRSYVSDPPQ